MTRMWSISTDPTPWQWGSRVEAWALRHTLGREEDTRRETLPVSWLMIQGCG
jgi:hypothetical protein